jgi:hypothetical protein
MKCLKQQYYVGLLPPHCMAQFISNQAPKITAFDLVRYMNATGQVNHVATVLCKLREQLHNKKLAELLKNDG